MVAFLVSLVLSQSPAVVPDGGCVLEGVVSLKRDGRRVTPTEAVVYVKDGPPRARPEPVDHVITQKDFQFWPQSLVVMVNDRIKFVNKDTGREHSVFSQLGVDPFPGDLNNRTTTFTRTFAKEGAVHIQCNVHEEMMADVLVLRSAAFTRPDEQGKFRISGLERKAYTLVVWEPSGAEESAEVAACASGPFEFNLVKKFLPPPLRRDGTRYRPEYNNAY